MVLPVVGQALVERAIFFWGDVRGITRPDRLSLVQFLVFGGDLLNLLRLFLFNCLLIFDFFNLVTTILGSLLIFYLLDGGKTFQ